MPRTLPPARPIPLDAYLRRRAVRRWAGGAGAVLIAALLLFADRRGWLLSESGEWSTYHGRTFRVVHVVDGDTLDVDFPDGHHPHTRIRFWGIDAPETAKPREGKAADPFGDEAHAFTRKLCAGGSVTLHLDARQPRDRYGRLLAYLILPDGSVVNETLLLEGLARNDPRFPHQQLDRYELLEKQAKFEKKGLWAK